MVSEARLSCHIGDGQDGRTDPKLSNVGSRLSRDRLVWRILNGSSNVMSAYGEMLSLAEVEELAAFRQAQREE